MKSISKDILGLVGNTPLVKLNRITNGLACEVFAKLEAFNPLSSVKDRTALALVEAGEREGKLKKGSVIVEPTSGNTGIGLAFVSRVKGYKLILTMPDTMSIERQSLLRALGAELVLTPGSEGMTGALKRADEIAKNTPNSYIPQQFKNPANPDVHRRTTGQEIWSQTKGKIDIFVTGVGTGGTITGVGEALKARKKSVKVVAVEPDKSPVLSGGKPAPHGIQGIGAGFIPRILNRSIIDEVVRIKDEEAFDMTRRLAKEEGIFAGISSGAAAHAAVQVAKRPENKGKVIVTIFPDSGDRYLSTQTFF